MIPQVTYRSNTMKRSASVVVLILAFMNEKPSEAQDVCRLNEARQIACAAANKSWEIDHNWPRAQGVFAANMSYLQCGESRKWDGVCR